MNLGEMVIRLSLDGLSCVLEHACPILVSLVTMDFVQVTFLFFLCAMLLELESHDAPDRMRSAVSHRSSMPISMLRLVDSWSYY